MPLMKLHVRSVCVTLSNAKVFISPGSRLKPEHFKAIPGVTDIVAPNLFHCSGVIKARSNFPSAKIWGVEGVRETKTHIPWNGIFGRDTWPHQAELPAVVLRGIPKINEVVFVHKESRSLIVSDLAFNLVDVSGFGPWLILSLFGTYKKFGVSKFFLRFMKDRPMFEESLRELFSYDFDRIVVGHGRNIENGGKELLRRALIDRGLKF